MRAPQAIAGEAAGVKARERWTDVPTYLPAALFARDNGEESTGGDEDAMSGSGSTTIAAGGTLTMSGAATTSVTGRALIANGTIVQTGAGGLSSTGALTVGGAAAVLDLGASHSATAATVTVDGGGSITGTGTSGVTATTSFAMKSGAVGVILRGTGIPLNETTAGTVTLSGARRPSSRAR